MKKDLKFELSPALAGKFEVVGTVEPTLHSRIGLVDFRTMSEEKAEQLIKAGTRYLVRLKKANGTTN